MGESQDSKPFGIVPSPNRALGRRVTNLVTRGLKDIARLQAEASLQGDGVRVESKSAFAWWMEGMRHVARDHWEEAIRCLDRAIEIDPKDAEMWHFKRFCLSELGLGRHEEAIHCCDRAIEIDAEDKLAWRAKGGSLRYLGRREEAIRCYDRALEIDPEDGDARKWRDVCLRDLGRD